MTLWRHLSLTVVLGIAAVPAAAQDNAPTMGRSIATLARVPLRSSKGADILFGSRVASGKPTLVTIWASWCGPCIAEAPYFDKIRKTYAGRYNFIYVNRREGFADPSQPPEAVAGFLARTGMADVDYVMADARAYRQLVGPDIRAVPEGMVGIPRVYLFDRHGRQVYTAMGFDTADPLAVERRLRKAIAS